MQTDLTVEPLDFASRPGISLKHAYRPSSETEVLACYQEHSCAACGESTLTQDLPEVSLLQLGPVFFKSLSKPCNCGYVNEILVVFNNLLQRTDLSIPGAEEAIAQADQTNQLPDPFLEEQLVASTVAIHQEQLELALAINRNLTVRFPQFFLPFYNLAVIYSRQQHSLKSLAAFEDSLIRNPHHSDSLSGKALVHLKLYQFKEAGITYEQWRNLNPEGTVILAELEGVFGKIRVVDDAETRSLHIEQQNQGTVYKIPAADELEPTCRPGPGPLSPNLFAAGFVILGCQFPQSSGLVLGLGCGASIMMNLACFPEMHLTVVEIDPRVIQLCQVFFPLVQHYIDSGRLEIIKADAETFLNTNQRHFDFIQCDVYQGKPELPSTLRSIESIHQMSATASVIFVNIIGKLCESHLHQVLDAFDRSGNPIYTLYPSNSIQGNEATYMNWLGSTQPSDRCAEFVPFPDWSGNAVEQVRKNFAQLRDNATSRAILETYRPKILLG